MPDGVTRAIVALPADSILPIPSPSSSEGQTGIEDVTRPSWLRPEDVVENLRSRLVTLDNRNHLRLVLCLEDLLPNNRAHTAIATRRPLLELYEAKVHIFSFDLELINDTLPAVRRSI